MVLLLPTMTARAAGPAAPRTGKVATGPARSLGEPAAAQDSAASAVTATTFGAAGAQAGVWTRRADTTAWRRAGSILPSGFGTSYDPAAAAAPGGPLLVVAGTAPPGESCITNGSVAIASVDSSGRLGAARLVSDQRGTGSFDDRPTVAVGAGGMVWVAWSQGPDGDACQNVGSGDRIEVAASRDDGRTFGAPTPLPADGGSSAFGVRLAPLPGGQVAVSWTETMATGDQGVLVSVVGADGRPGQPTVALSGDGPPLVLPGASFYDFPAGDMAALPNGRLLVAAPFWVADRSVIELASGTPGGRWQKATVRPPGGSDLLLPALGLLTSVDVRLVCAVHIRVGDRLGYDWASLAVNAQGAPNVGSAGLTALTAAPAGPGFFEIGEELALSHTPGGLLGAVVVAGQDGAALETATFTAPPAAATPAAATPRKAGATPPGSSSSRSPSGSGRTGPGTGGARAGDGGSSGLGATVAWVAGAVALCCAVGAGALVLRRRRAASGRHQLPSHRRQ